MSARESFPARTFDPFLEGMAPPGPPTTRRPATSPGTTPSRKRKPRSKAKRKSKTKRR